MGLTEKIMSNNTSYDTAKRELTSNELAETELEHVAGGKPSADFPTETVKLTYGEIQWEYTRQ